MVKTFLRGGKPCVTSRKWEFKLNISYFPIIHVLDARNNCGHSTTTNYLNYLKLVLIICPCVSGLYFRIDFSLSRISHFKSKYIG